MKEKTYGICDDCQNKTVIGWNEEETRYLCNDCLLDRLQKRIYDLEQKLDDNYYGFKKED